MENERIIKNKRLVSHHKERDTKQKGYGTRYSQAVSHPSTNQARPCLASKIRQGRVHSGWCGLRLGQLSPRRPMRMRLHSPACQGAQPSTSHSQRLWQLGGSGSCSGFGGDGQRRASSPFPQFPCQRREKGKLGTLEDVPGSLETRELGT